MTILPSSSTNMASTAAPHHPSYARDYGYDDEYDAAPHYRPPSGPPPPAAASSRMGPGPNFARPPRPGAGGPPPPAYQRVMQRISLRPVLLFTTSISILYLVFSAAVSLRSLNQTGETGKLKTFDVILGILLLVAAVVELLGLSAAWTSRLSWATLYARASTIALALVVGAEVVGIVEHYVAKTDLIAGCTTRNTGTNSDTDSSWWLWGSGSDGASTTMTAAEAQAYCEARWSRTTAWVIIWYVRTVQIIVAIDTLTPCSTFSLTGSSSSPSSVVSLSSSPLLSSANFGTLPYLDPVAEAFRAQEPTPPHSTTTTRPVPLRAVDLTGDLTPIPTHLHQALPSRQEVEV
ncbi:hypothetical protein BCV69DRAFT_156942 [Microstroma glucosiphilum]|uniref:Uncharacterized protein n=1 Tax=Pseudomicrostroma glucosiphilum TaxID=1684307 RepID=A0A316U9K8_9BASI|nr:hypothetical protein BCV69DRAFT_156942 [Pseudomicrostroma glucosiphilum]PWN21839.1 hypothetical protein BCV69DRAFT_156942 [Pseudomicrostroma glucosiphilum]